MTHVRMMARMVLVAAFTLVVGCGDGGDLFCFGDIPCATGGTLSQCTNGDLTVCAWEVNGQVFPCSSCEDFTCLDEAEIACDGE
ncbi:MAG: hypothetical protein AAF500_14215 [Myxococcota bacterium]